MVDVPGSRTVTITSNYILYYNLTLWFIDIIALEEITYYTVRFAKKKQLKCTFFYGPF